MCEPLRNKDEKLVGILEQLMSLVNTVLETVDSDVRITPEQTEQFKKETIEKFGNQMIFSGDDVKSAVKGLQEEIYSTHFEQGCGYSNHMHKLDVIELIKKWFPDVINND